MRLRTRIGSWFRKWNFRLKFSWKSKPLSYYEGPDMIEKKINDELVRQIRREANITKN